MRYEWLGGTLGHGHGCPPNLSPYRSYPYPVPGPWSYNPVYPAGYAGPDPLFVENDDGTMTQVAGETPVKKGDTRLLWFLLGMGVGVAGVRWKIF